MSTETPSTFRDVMAYVERFHHDLGQMVALVEKLMGREGYEALSRYGNRACWQLTSDYRRPDAWNAPHVGRAYIREGEETHESLLVVLSVCQADAAFDFPPVLCLRCETLPVREARYVPALFSKSFPSLTWGDSDWHSCDEERGWFTARQNCGGLECSLHGYILNLFDMTDADAVADNIIRPLTHPDENLDDMLTVTKYRFPAMDADTNA